MEFKFVEVQSQLKQVSFKEYYVLYLLAVFGHSLKMKKIKLKLPFPKAKLEKFFFESPATFSEMSEYFS